MSKQPPPAPTVSTIGPCPTVIQVRRTPWHWKFTQHLRTTRPPPGLGQATQYFFFFFFFFGGGGGNIPFNPSPNHPPTFSFDFFVKQQKGDYKCTKLKGVAYFLFACTGKSIPFKYIIEFAILSDLKMRNVIICSDNDNCKQNVQ